MAARKERLEGAKFEPPPDAAHPFTVVLEEIRAQGKVFGEGHQLLREQMQAGFEEVNRRFEQVEGRLERVEQDMALVKDAVV